ncbi:MAG: branched-chain amino acid ABC transporter permease [Spirochaetales bacterium]|nr:branched-chain amino acid ABC transporter permease [Spirochaetales bacterium]
MKRTSQFFAVAVGLFGLVFPFIFGPYLQKVASTIYTFMALAITWDILLRSGQISFGIAGFYGLGSYATILLVMKAGLPFWIAVPAGVLIAGFFAWVLGFLVLRLRGMYFSITTLALAEIFRVIIHNWSEFTGGPEGLVLPSIIFGGESKALYWALYATLLITIGVSVWFERSKFHFALTSIRDNEIAASTAGIDIFRTLLVTFTVTSLLQGLIGAVNVVSVGFAMPESAFDANYTLLPLAIALLGGIHSTVGPMIGALLLGATAEWLKLKIPYGHLAVYGLIIILVILFMPQGIRGLVRQKLAERGTHHG